MADPGSLEDFMSSVLDGATPTPDGSGNVDLVPFAFNPLHDLESIWWMATFFIFHHFTITDSHHDRRLLNARYGPAFPYERSYIT